MTAAIDTAVEAFREALIAEGGLDGVQVSDADEVGRRAALLVRGATAWREHLGDLLDVRDVMALLKVTTRQAVYDLVQRRRLIGLRRDGGSMAFPAFQFNPDTGRPFEVVGDVVDVFVGAGVDAYTVASWMATAQDELDGVDPKALFADRSAADAILSGARRTATRLSH